MMHRLILAFVFLLLPLQAAPLKVEVASESALLINMETGHVLFEKNSKTLRYPASTTKIATALYALKERSGDLDKMVTADKECVATVKEEDKRRSNYSLNSYLLEPGGSHIGIKKGETLSLKDLMAGMMIASGNDAANVIANEIGGSINAFMKDLNGYLKEIGCQDTCFYNPHGLHHPKHQTTAFDMAIIAKEAMKHPYFREIVSMTRFERPATNKQPASVLLQTNKLLRKGKLYYPKAIGIKTGCLTISQKTLVTAASSDGRTLLAVLFKCKERDDIYKDAIRLFETAFNQPKMKKKWIEKDSFSLILPSTVFKEGIKVASGQDFYLEYYPAEEPEVKSVVEWNTNLEKISQGQEIAKLHLTDAQGRSIANIPLLALDNHSKGIFHSITDWFSSFWGLLSIGLMLILGALIFLFRR